MDVVRGWWKSVFLTVEFAVQLDICCCSSDSDCGSGGLYQCERVGEDDEGGDKGEGEEGEYISPGACFWVVICHGWSALVRLYRCKRERRVEGRRGGGERWCFFEKKKE